MTSTSIQRPRPHPYDKLEHQESDHIGYPACQSGTRSQVETLDHISLEEDTEGFRVFDPACHRAVVPWRTKSIISSFS